MSIAGKIIEYEWEWLDQEYRLFAKAGQIAGKLNGLTEVGLVNPAPQTVSVPGHTRRRYPGGPGISVAGFDRVTLLGGDANRRTLPGANAYLEITTGTGSSAVTDVTTVTFTGPFTALYQFVNANAEVAMVLRSPDGTPYDIVVSD